MGLGLKNKKTRILKTGQETEVKKRVILRPEVQVFSERLLIPTNLIAHAFDVTYDAVMKWGIKPVVKESQAALLYLPEVIANRMGYGENGAPKLNPAQEKALLDRTRREKAELELAEKRGDLVSISSICKIFENQCVAVRQKLLAIPNKLARTIMTAQNPQEAQDLMLSAISKALEDLIYDDRVREAAHQDADKSTQAPAEDEPS